MKTKNSLYRKRLTVIISILMAAVIASGCKEKSDNLALLLAAGLSGGGVLLTNSVLPLNQTNGLNWNDYFQNSYDSLIMTDSDAAVCAGTEAGYYTACHHGGEKRKIQISEYTSCTGLTGDDSLGAFDWKCEFSGGSVYMVSTGLKSGKFLSDLIEFGAAPADPAAWKSIVFNLYRNNKKVGYTNPSVWWTNPFVIDNNGMLVSEMNVPGTIYLVTDPSASGFYSFGADKIGLVIKPGVTLQDPSTSQQVIETQSRKFLWIEGSVNAAGHNRGIYFEGITFSVIRNAETKNADATASGGTLKTGIHLTSSSSKNSLSYITSYGNVECNIRLDVSTGYNSLDNITVNMSKEGFKVSSSNYNTFTNIKSLNNTISGITMSGSSNNTIQNAVMSKNDIGIYLQSISTQNKFDGITVTNSSTSAISAGQSTKNIFIGIVTTGSTSFGLDLLSSSHDNVLLNISSINNGSIGMFPHLTSNNNFIGQYAGINNQLSGLYLNTSSNNTFENISSGNGSYGVYLTGANNNTFTGLLKISSSVTKNCYVASSTNPGLVDTTCANQGTSDAVLSTGVDYSSSFTGKASSDSANADGSSGTASYPADPSVFDWLNFENRFRGWGIDGSAFPNSDHRSNWTTGTGRIWDWSLSSGNAVLRNVLSIPTGNDTITHAWSDASTTTFLRNAVEFIGDEIGNDNGLCESNESCLYSPNIGAYQGHGSLTDIPFTDGTITGVTLKKYSVNGR